MSHIIKFKDCKKEMSLNKFVKALSILSEMFDYRKGFEKKEMFALYDSAQTYLEKYLKNGSYHTDFSRSDIVVDASKIRVVFNLDEKWDVRNLKQVRKQMLQKDAENISHYIIILSKPSTSIGANQPNETNNYINKELRKSSEIFYLSELQYNVTKHYIVPKHELIKDVAQKEYIMNEYSAKHMTQFPLILSSDPVVRFIGGKEGHLIKITRNPSHVGEHVLYRYCVSG